MMRSDVTVWSWNSPAPLAGNTGFYLSRSVSAKQSGWLQNLWTGAGTCVHCTNTCPRYQPLWPATWSSASLTHGQAYHKTSSSWSMEKAVTCKHEGKMTSLWTSAKLKPALFRATNTEYAYHFWKYADAVGQKLSKLVHSCRNYSLPKLAHF